MSGYKQYDENLKWGSLDACGVDEWLVQEVVYQLSEAEYCNHYQGKPYEAYIQADRYHAAVLDHNSQGCADHSSEEGTQIRDYVKDSGEYCNADSCVESKSCYEDQADKVDQRNTCHFYKYSREVSCKQMTDVGKSIYSFLFIFVRYNGCDDLAEEVSVLYEEETDEADREKADADA